MEKDIPERRFTLRLSDVESKAIDELKSIVRETTDSAVVRRIINDYKRLYLEHEAEKRKNSQLERKIWEIEENLSILFSTLKKLDATTTKKKK
jgi:hypothetical protein